MMRWDSISERKQTPTAEEANYVAVSSDSRAKDKLSDICSRDTAQVDRAISGLDPMN